MVGDNVKMANLQAAKSALVNQMAVQKLTGASQADLLVTQKRIQNIDKEIGSMRVAKAAMEEQRVSAQRLSTALQGAAGIMTTMGTAATAIGVFGAMGLKNLVDTAIDYQKQSALTRTQVDKFATSLRDVEDIGIRLARTIGVPFEQIQPALFNIFSSMEVGAADAEKLLTVFAKASVAGQVDIQAASTATIGILNAFHLPLSTINHLMDVQFQLVKEGIGTYEEWTTRIGLVTPSAVRAGQSVEMMAAALAVSTRMGISAAQSGTAVARAMDALSNPAAVDSLRELGVNATDAQGNFRSMIDILGDFRTALGKIPGEEAKVAKIIEVFKGAGGTIQARRFLQNMLLTPGNLELFKTIFDTMSTETGSFEQAYAIMADTTATKSQLMKNQWEAVKIAAGEALIPTFQKIIGWFSKAFEWFNKLPESQKKYITQLLAFGVAASIVGGILLLLIGTILAFAAAFAVAGGAMLGVLSVIALVITAIGALAAMFIIAWKKSERFRDVFLELGTTIKDFYEKVLLPAGIAIKTAFVDEIVPALTMLWDVISNKLLPILVMFGQYIEHSILEKLAPVISFLRDTAIDVFERVHNVIKNHVVPAIKEFTDFLHEHEDTIKTIIDVWSTIGKIAGYVAVVIGIVLASAVGITLFLAFKAVIAVIEFLITVFGGLIDAIQTVWGWLKDFWNFIQPLFTSDFWSGLGSSIIDGVVQGIKNGAQTVFNAIGDVATGALHWAAEKLGIGSPSKEFMKLGVYSMEGFAQGISKGTPAIRAQVTSTTAGMTNAVSSSGNEGSGRIVHQEFNITTQEIDPRRHAAELGYLLSGRP